MPEAADNHLRQGGAVGGQLEVQHPLRIAGGLLGQGLMPLQQAHLPTACGQAGGAGATGQATTDHQGVALAMERGRAREPGFDRSRRGRLGGPAEKLTAQDFPFMTDARRALHLETGGVDQAPYPAGAGEGADGRAGGCQACQFGEQLGGPHLGVFRRGEAVEKPRVDLGVQLRQLLHDIADQQGQGHPAVIQHQLLEAWMNGDVLGQQLLGEGLQWRPEGEGALQVGVAQRVLFHADKMQARTGHGVLFEQLPGAEKVQAGAEAGLANHQPPAHRQGRKAFLQAVLLEEHVAGFFKAGLIGEVHVVKHPRVRATLVIPVELGVGQYGGHGRLIINEAGNGKAAILADQLPTH